MTAPDAVPDGVASQTPDRPGRYPVDVSVIIACYREEAAVSACYEQLREALGSQARSWEVIFVNDGSTDGTLDVLLAIARRDPRVVVIDFTENYGQWHAFTAGICLARGETFAFLDCDLQLDPADLIGLLERLDEGYDLVGGRRMQREDSALRKGISRLGNYLLADLTKGELKDIGCSMKVVRAELLHAFDFGPMTPVRPMQVISCATRVAELPITHHRRPHGESKWPVAVLVTNFGFAALDLLQGRMRRLGLYSWLAAFIAMAIYAAGPAGVARTAFIAAAILVQAGVILIIVDLLILTLVARRVQPAYRIRHIHHFPASSGDER